MIDATPTTTADDAPAAAAAPRVLRLRHEVAIMFFCRAAAMVMGAVQSIVIARALGPTG